MTENDDTWRFTDRLSRRQFLATSAATSAALAGCLGGSDDDGETTADGDGDEPSAGAEANAPGPGSTVVENPPDAVYLPTHREAFQFLPMEQAGDYMLMPHWTYAHTFWLMRDEEREPVEPEPQTLHFMFMFWDAETGSMLPVDAAGIMNVSKDGDRIDGPRNPWPMISQGMGFHFGDNVPFASEDYEDPFPEPGTYEIELQMDPISARKTGAFEGRFEEPVSTTIEFEFSIEDLEEITENVEFLDEERWGEPGALPLMDHGGHGDHHDDGHDDGHDDDHDHDDGNGDEDDGYVGYSYSDDDHDHDDDHENGHEHDHPEMALPEADQYPGTHLGTYESGDARFVLRYLEDSRLAQDGDNYLLVSARTPYNRIPLPDMALSVRGDIEGELTQTLDGELNHHYGLTTDIEDGDEFELVVESPPQVSRHQGYETAFIDMPAMAVDVQL